MALRTSELIGREWTEFLEEFTPRWDPGQHVSVVAPTGVGKSTVVGGLLGLRRFVLVVDPKGGDDTLTAFRFRRLPKWPGERRMERMIDEDVRKKRPSHYIIGPESNHLDDLPLIKQAAEDALRGAYNMRRWTLYIDELQVLCDRRLMNLTNEVVRWLISARSGGRTLISSFQAPSWVPPEALRQPTWIVASHTRDRDVIDRTAEIAGRPKEELRGWMEEIDPFHWIVVPRNPRAPVWVTHPPKLG